MWKFCSKIFLIVLSLGMVHSGVCSAEPERHVVRKRIVVRKKIPQYVEPAPEVARPAVPPSAKVPKAKLQKASLPELERPVVVKKKKVSIPTPRPKLSAAPSKAKPASPGKKAIAFWPKAKPEELGLKIPTKVTCLYDPRGKIDPFKPLFQEKAEPAAPVRKKVKKKRIPLTPLQKIALSQLRLVAIVVSATGNKALVEDPSGKGYIIAPGTYVGKKFGRVKKILKDRVLIEEEVEDLFSGKIKPKIVQLKLKKRY